MSLHSERRIDFDLWANQIAIDVYESNSAFTELGAGIILRDRTLRYLTELGLLDDINAINGRVKKKAHTGKL